MPLSSQKFRKQLLCWYQAQKRDLPWRKFRDPYAIWLSEIMLQQTTVATVIPYYNRFLGKFPTLKSVAQAPIEELLKLWAGLGYYRRIRHFHESAQKIFHQHDGKIPSTKEALKNLKGLGEYTASAIASIAFGEPVAVVDGNVIRVMARLFAIHESVDSLNVQKNIAIKAQKLLDKNNPGDFNQAMMELGATVCTPSNPKCLLCPVLKGCAAFKEGRPESYPVKGKKMAYVKEHSMALVVEHEGCFLMRQRTKKEIMEGLWEVPTQVCEGAPSLKAVKQWIEDLNLPLNFEPALMRPVSHAIMNRRMQIRPFKLVLSNRPKNLVKDWHWVSVWQKNELPLSTVTKKILKDI